MRLRLAKINELQFLRCLQHGLWGSNRGLRGWMEGDILAFIVDRNIAGLAEITGKSFYSDERVWDNGLFAYRIPVKFVQVLTVNDRVPIIGPVRDVLTSAWGRQYGWGILNKVVLPQDAGEVIVKEILSKPNALEAFQRELPKRIQQAGLQKEAYLRK